MTARNYSMIRVEYVIYRIYNTSNFKSYVGQTKDFLARKSQHLSQLRTNMHYNYHLQNAFNKYGAAGFDVEILETGMAAQGEINRREIYWIKRLNSRKNGYNLTDGGTNTSPIIKMRVQWNGILYPSQKDAANAIGVSAQTLRAWLDKGYTRDKDVGVKYLQRLRANRAKKKPVTNDIVYGDVIEFTIPAAWNDELYLTPPAANESENADD